MRSLFMKLFFILFSGLIFSCLTQAKELVVSLGEPYEVKTKPSLTIWIEDGKMLQANPQGSRLFLKGRQEGMTTMRIGSETFKVHILHPEKKDTFMELQKTLSSIIGLSPQISEGELTVSGNLYRFEEWQHLADKLQKTSITFQIKVKMSPQLQKISQSHFAVLFEKAKIPPQAIVFEPAPEVRVSGSDIILKKYQQLLRPYGVKVIKDDQSIDVAPTIKVQITVAEVSKDLTRKHGIAWPGDFKATLLKAPSSLVSSLELDLQALESTGEGKILASPNIICRSGKEAEFLAGGEFPIKVMNYKVHDIIWKKYGILLKVKPKADTSGRMSIALETEVSRVDESRKIDDVPAILTNRVSSHFDLTGPQTIALSGLLKDENINQSQGLPGLANIPILGALFSSKNFKENKTELIIFVRPSIMSEGIESESNEHLGVVGVY